ncbi:hypothetical protein N7456_002968 [Penicillium angulare]|uniref:Ankyrin n=1 Tax=Penicillium angulare TaxID=116970 RepID=A0A9W9FTW3_9EURO|nr:hypothetical protein N7456_002968 [Penicillium angulare]
MHRYVEYCGLLRFGETSRYEDYYFLTATKYGKTDALRALTEIHESHPSQTRNEPLLSRMERANYRLLNEACANAQFETAEYLMNCGPPLGELFNERGYADAPLVSVLAALKFVKSPPRGRIVTQSNIEIEQFVYSLLDRGASVRGQSTGQSNVLGAAAPLGSYELASRLISEGADLHGKEIWWEMDEGKTDNVTALHLASGAWNLPFIQALREHYGTFELTQAARATDSRGRVPLHWALSCLSNGLNWVSDDTLSTGLEVINLLLELNPEAINTQSSHGAVFNFLTNGPILGAATLTFMKVLLDYNPSIDTVNAQDQAGATALLRILSSHETCNAVRESYTIPLIELLLAHGADRSICDNKGQTALHKLGSSPSYDDPISPDLLEMFIPFVDLNQADINGWTALHWMARNLRQVEPCRLLVKRGADVNVVDNKGNTPVHQAVGGRLVRREKIDKTIDWPTVEEKIRACNEMITVLIEAGAGAGAGASMDRPNLEGKTPTQLRELSIARWELEKRRGR